MKKQVHYAKGLFWCVIGLEWLKLGNVHERTEITGIRPYRMALECLKEAKEELRLYKK